MHAAGWLVESGWLDRDGTGERTWNRAVDPHGVEIWCTTSQLQQRLHRAGLDIGDLTLADPAHAPSTRDIRSRRRQAAGNAPNRYTIDRTAASGRRPATHTETQHTETQHTETEHTETELVDVDDECE